MVSIAYSGKDFENNFKDSWLSQLPNQTLLRLYDTTNGFRGVANPCDYILGTKTSTLYLECKTVKEASFSFNDLSENQFNQLIDVSLHSSYTDGGVLIYFRDKQNILKYYPIEHIALMKLAGNKSVNPLKHLDYGFEINYSKKRTNIVVDCESLIKVFDTLYGEGSDTFWAEEELTYLREVFPKIQYTKQKK